MFVIDGYSLRYFINKPQVIGIKRRKKHARSKEDFLEKETNFKTEICLHICIKGKKYF